MGPKRHQQYGVDANGLEEILEKKLVEIFDIKFNQLNEKIEKSINSMKEYVDDKVMKELTTVTNEFESRKDSQRNIIVYGLDEDENLSDQIKDLLDDLDLEEVVDDIKFKMRLGKQMDGKIRPIKIGFHLTSSAEECLKKSKILKGRSIWIREDLTKIQLEKLRNLKMEAQKKNDDADLKKKGLQWILVGRRGNPHLKLVNKSSSL